MNKAGRKKQEKITMNQANNQDEASFHMSDLILIAIGNGQPARCADLDDAKAKALTATEDQVVVEITPAGPGGPMITLEFDRRTQDWFPLYSLFFS